MDQRFEESISLRLCLRLALSYVVELSQVVVKPLSELHWGSGTGSARSCVMLMLARFVVFLAQRRKYAPASTLHFLNRLRPYAASCSRRW